MKRILFVILFCSFMFGAVPAIYAQDVTPEVTATQVVVEQPPAPTAEATAVETATPPENPRGGLQFADFLPYVVPVAIIAILAFFALMGGVVLALWKSVPAAAKPIVYPMLESGVNALLNAGDNYAKTTVSTADNDLMADLRAEMNQKLAEFRAEMEAARVQDAKRQVEAISSAMNGAN